MRRRILSLGAGAMGNIAAQTAASFKETESLMIADINLIAAQAVASLCGNQVKAARIDVTNHNELLEAMRQVDLVMNCVGPFFRFGVPILEAAIEAGVDYFDICDDPEPTRAMHELHDRAREVKCYRHHWPGGSPGITSMLAVRAKEELDETDELIAGWNIEEDDGGDDQIAFSAAIVHWMQQCSGTILECENRNFIEKRPLAEVSLEYPGRGRRTVYTVGHPEPVSFHYSFPDLQRSFCVMVMPRLWAKEFRNLADQIDQGMMTLEEAGEKLLENAASGSLMDARFLDRPRLPVFFALAKGRKEGKSTRVATTIRSIPRDMARATGIPLALGVQLYLQGRVVAKGVMAPEIAFRSAEFFDLLSPYCTFPTPVNAAELVEVSRAVDFSPGEHSE